MTDWGEDAAPGSGEAAPGSEDTATASAAETPPPSLVFGSTDEFVREYLRHVYRRKIDARSRVWAADWWRYDEAVIRLEAIWRAWEHLRLDPATGMAVWWRDYADPMMEVLMNPIGPFAAASTSDEANQCAKGAPLPYADPPEGLFPDVRTADT